MVQRPRGNSQQQAVPRAVAQPLRPGRQERTVDARGGHVHHREPETAVVLERDSALATTTMRSALRQLPVRRGELR